MLTQSIFDDLARKYGRYASWAIWNPVSRTDTQIISSNLQDLKTSVVMVGLNISAPLSHEWSNFHGDRHDRKLMMTFNDSSYRGAYLTDLIKGEVEANSNIIRARVRREEIDIHKHILDFRHEMNNLGVEPHALFILFGGVVQEFFITHLSGSYQNYVGCPHYSCRGTDKEWIRRVGGILESHSSATKSKFNTLPFSVLNASTQT